LFSKQIDFISGTKVFNNEEPIGTLNKNIKELIQISQYICHVEDFYESLTAIDKCLIQEVDLSFKQTLNELLHKDTTPQSMIGEDELEIKDAIDNFEG
jgi:hypothetical protein